MLLQKERNTTITRTQLQSYGDNIILQPSTQSTYENTDASCSNAEDGLISELKGKFE